MKTIGIIDNYDSFVYNLVRYIRECENVRVIVQRNDALQYEELDHCDAILLSPGPGIPDEAGGLKQLIHAYADKKPMLGICLGHQAIAEVFGSQLEQCPEPVHGKASLLQVEDDSLLFEGLPAQFPVGRYHSWRVQNEPNPSLTITGRTEDGTIMAFRHSEYPVRGLQFHPESILTPNGRQLIQNWVNSIKEQ